MDNEYDRYLVIELRTHTHTTITVLEGVRTHLAPSNFLDVC